VTLLKLSIAAAVIVMAISGSADADDPLDRRMVRLSSESFDCGSTSEFATNRAKVNACVTEHFLKAKPFRVRFEVRCEDSKCATGLVLQSQPGLLYVMTYDSEGCQGTHASDPFCGTGIEACQKPTLVPMGKGLKLSCKNEYRF